MFNEVLKSDLEDNSCFCELIKRTETAYNLNCLRLDYSKLVELLTSDDKNLRCYALLILSFLNDKDSRIRDFASNLIKEHLINPETRYLFDNNTSRDIFIESVKDINPKVCKNITYALQHMDNKVVIIEKMIKIIDTGNIFTVYWGLCAIENLLTTNDENINSIEKIIIDLITKTSGSKEYHIREKTAFIIKILTKNLNNRYNNIVGKIQELVEKLLNDENFYVRNAINPTN